MNRWSCSDRLALILAAWVMLTPAVLAHPDLLAQIERLDEQIHEEPDNPELLIRRGDLYRRHEEYGAAARDFEAARLLDPGHPELNFYQGRLALQTGNFEVAAGFLDRYLASHPRQAIGWMLRGETALAQRDAAAAASFERAVRFSEAPSPELYRKWVLALLTAGDTSGAMEAAEAGIRQLGAEVTLLGLGTDVALTEHDGKHASTFLQLLPAGLEHLAPWSDRYHAVDCLTGQTAGAANEAADCATSAARRLAVQLQSIR